MLGRSIEAISVGQLRGDSRKYCQMVAPGRVELPTFGLGNRGFHLHLICIINLLVRLGARKRIQSRHSALIWQRIWQQGRTAVQSVVGVAINVAHRVGPLHKISSRVAACRIRIIRVVCRARSWIRLGCYPIQ